MQGKELPQVLLGASPAALEPTGNFLVQTWKAKAGQGPGKHLIPGHALWLLARASGCERQPCQGDPSQEDALIRQLSLVRDPRGSAHCSAHPQLFGIAGDSPGAAEPLSPCPCYPAGYPWECREIHAFPFICLFMTNPSVGGRRGGVSCLTGHLAALCCAGRGLGGLRGGGSPADDARAAPAVTQGRFQRGARLSRGCSSRLLTQPRSAPARRE